MRDEAISVLKIGYSDPMKFRVLTATRAQSVKHTITLTNAQAARLTGGMASSEMLVEAAFRFLLERIPREKIVERFDLPAIGQYFPEFERELPMYLAKVRSGLSLADTANKKRAAAATPSNNCSAS